MDDMLTQLGVGGLIAVLLVREILGFLKHKNGNGNGNGSHSRVERALALERWKAVEEAIRASTASIRNNTQVLSTLAHHVEETRREMKDAVIECRREKR